MINKEETEIKIRKLGKMSNVVGNKIYADKEKMFILVLCFTNTTNAG
jgi:hypothetical protein